MVDQTNASRLEFDGYHYRPLNNTNGMAVCVRHNNESVDVVRVIDLSEDCNKLLHEATRYLIHSICDAVNAGVSADDLGQILTNLVPFLERTCPYQLGDFKPAGMVVKRYAAVDYILVAQDSSDQVVVISPGHQTRVLDVATFTHEFKGHNDF